MIHPIDPELYSQLSKSDTHQGTHHLGGFSYQLNLNYPVIATAIHAGHNYSLELSPYLEISELGRLFEEDVATDRFIENIPNSLIGLDSRAEYDLNRLEEVAVPLTPDHFWGVRVFKETPPKELVNRSLEKYHAFHRFLKTVTVFLVEKFGCCVIHDIHSYNRSRQIEKGFDPPPLFNLGTMNLDRNRWDNHIEDWLEKLSAISLPNLKTTVAENLIFPGNGVIQRSMKDIESKVLVLATEVAKSYMNEHTGELYEGVINSISIGLKDAIMSHSELFQKQFQN